MPLTALIIIFALLVLTGLGLVLWLIRQRRQMLLAQAGFVHTRPLFADTDLSAGERGDGGSARYPDSALSDQGYDASSLYQDTPTNSRYESRFASSSPSLFPEDFAQSTMPQALTLTEAPQPTRQLERERIQRAMQALGDGPVDRAWQTLQGFFPDKANREAALQTLAQIAQAYDRDARHECARDVYEHMADIDPNWPDIKPMLTRARDLAQNATTSAWGTLPTRPTPHIGQQSQMGPYMIEAQIGKGAMGAVYRGVEPISKRQVALKTMALAQEFSGAELADARARFMREADMAGRLKHPDIVRIFEAGEQEGVAYIAMELIDGVDMSQYTAAATLLPLAQLLPIAARVAEALAYAHSRGVTHRDIKPANIMVNLERNLVKVMDFGVARVADTARTRTGIVLGTPTYMSPEQLSGQNVDSRSDLYSFGVSLFQLLTGQLPYRNDSMAALMRAIGRDPVPDVCTLRADLPPALGHIVALALEKTPSTRYASGLQMAQDLRDVMASFQHVDLDLA